MIPPETEKYVHHWLVYECDRTLETQYLAYNPIPKPASCLTGTGPWGRVKSHCTRISLAWATGGNYDVTFPKEYGYPIGGPGDKRSKYLILEMHYENPSKDKSKLQNSNCEITKFFYFIWQIFFRCD